MTRSFKILGPVVVAACALGALLAPAASAQEFTAGSYPATLSGSQVGEHVFTVENGLTVTCPTAVFSGELTAQTDEIAGVTAKYGNEEAKCKAFGIIKATVKMNDCTYTFVDENSLSSAMEHNGTADIVCTGTPITIVAGNCEVQVGSQVFLGPVHYFVDTIASPDTLTVVTTIETEIEYNKTKDGLFCPLNGTGTKTDGSYESTTKVEAGSIALGLTP